MDYDAYTGQVYVPDMRNKLVDVLTPVISDSPPLPHEPDHIITLGAVPQSVAITSDGQFGFVALQGGNVAILDVPGKDVYSTVFVGGDPRFIITGLYPPLLTTPQQVATLGTAINVAAYVFVIALLVVPIIFIARRIRTKKT
jgi:DNA-binding beta-propeller fold protein YncE